MSAKLLSVSNGGGSSSLGLRLLIRGYGANLRGLAETLTGRGETGRRQQQQQQQQRRSLFSGPPLRSEGGGGGHWKRETPAGGLTELYVYQPESKTIWPNPELGVFSAVDQRFGLPGNVGLSKEDSTSSLPPVVQARPPGQSDVLARPTNVENQAQVLHTAHDYIHHMEEAEAVVCAGVLKEFPLLRGTSSFCCEVHEAPRLLEKEVQGLFRSQEERRGALSVLTMAQKTVNDMSVWSDSMEDEREALTEQFVVAAKEICARLKSEGHWADFIDPSSGTPYFDSHSSTTMFETDEKYRLLGFRIEDLGCCKVICHREFGRNVFVGTIFTNAHVGSGIIQDVLEELKLAIGRIDGDVKN